MWDEISAVAHEGIYLRSSQPLTSTAFATVSLLNNGGTDTTINIRANFSSAPADRADINLTADTSGGNIDLAVDGTTQITVDSGLKFPNIPSGAGTHELRWNSTGGIVTYTTISAGFDPSSIGESLIPDTTDSYDLGSAALHWQHLYLAGDIALPASTTCNFRPDTTDTGTLFLGSASLKWSLMYLYASAGITLTTSSAGADIILDAVDDIRFEHGATLVMAMDAGNSRVDFSQPVRFLTCDSSNPFRVMPDTTNNGALIYSPGTNALNITPASDNVGALALGTSAETWSSILIRGATVTLPDITSTTGTALVASGGSNQIYLDSSSEMFKENFRPLGFDPAVLFDFPTPREFRYRETKDYGFGWTAEELHEVCPQLVNLLNGKPFSIKHDRVVILLVEELKKIKEEVAALRIIN
jgi:hypothetical protein